MIQYRMYKTEYYEIDEFEQDRYNERMDFIESFCATQEESRLNRPSNFYVQFTDEPEPDRDDAFYDLTGDGWGPPYKLFADGRTDDQASEIAYRTQKESNLAAARPNAIPSNRRSPSNLARGSPNSASPRPSPASPLPGTQATRLQASDRTLTNAGDIQDKHPRATSDRTRDGSSI